MRSLTPKDIGAIARQARLDAELTQAQLGEKVGASRFWVAEFERGKPTAELGLALKALRALRLVLTVETKEAAQRRDEALRQPSQQRGVDLSSLLARSVTNEPLYLHSLKYDDGSRTPSKDPTSEKRKKRNPNR